MTVKVDLNFRGLQKFELLLNGKVGLIRFAGLSIILILITVFFIVSCTSFFTLNRKISVLNTAIEQRSELSVSMSKQLKIVKGDIFATERGMEFLLSDSLTLEVLNILYSLTEKQSGTVFSSLSITPKSLKICGLYRDETSLNDIIDSISVVPFISSLYISTNNGANDRKEFTIDCEVISYKKYIEKLQDKTNAE